jgi:hypothetical protein
VRNKARRKACGATYFISSSPLPLFLTADIHVFPNTGVCLFLPLHHHVVVSLIYIFLLVFLPGVRFSRRVRFPTNRREM